MIPIEMSSASHSLLKEECELYRSRTILSFYICATALA